MHPTNKWILIFQMIFQMIFLCRRAPSEVGQQTSWLSDMKTLVNELHQAFGLGVVTGGVLLLTAPPSAAPKTMRCAARGFWPWDHEENPMGPGWRTAIHVVPWESVSIVVKKENHPGGKIWNMADLINSFMVIMGICHYWLYHIIDVPKFSVGWYSRHWHETWITAADPSHQG